MRNPIIIILFALLLLSLGALIVISTAPEVSNAVGLAHPDIKAMRAGGDGSPRLAAIGIYAFLFHCLVLCSIVVFFALGVSKRKRDEKLYAALTLLLAFSLFVWYRIYQGHLAFLKSKTTEFFLAFPSATAWMLYGVGLCGALLIVFYCVGFKRYIYNEEDAKSFAELVRKQQQQ